MSTQPLLSVASSEHQHAAPSAELVRVTPAMAEEWLSQNERNRALRPSRIATYAAAMRAGDWALTGEGVKFDWDGRLIDGQHRLHGVVSADMPVWMFVFRNLDPAAQMILDTGAKRSGADALKMAGLADAYFSEIASAAVIGIRYAEGVYRQTSRWNNGREVTNIEMMNWVRENPDIRDAVALGRQYSKLLNLPPSSLAFALMKLSRIDADACQEFLLNLRNMTTTGPGDPIFTLLRRLRSAADTGEYVRPAQVFILIFQTWNAWRAGEQLHTIRLSNGGAEIAVPEPK